MEHMEPATRFKHYYTAPIVWSPCGSLPGGDYARQKSDGTPLFASVLTPYVTDDGLTSTVSL